MRVKLLREPFILLETVEMLYKFVNGISFRSILTQRRPGTETETGDQLVRRLEQLQSIMEQTCQDLDPQDPDLQRFFGGVETGEKDCSVCLAKFMTCSFCFLEYLDLEESIQHIRRTWHKLQNDGAWISRYSPVRLRFSVDEGSPGDLLDQICALRLPAGFQLELYQTLRRFDQNLDELMTLIRPVALRLSQTIHQADWILDELAAYWEESTESPLEFLARLFGSEVGNMDEERTTMAISLMYSNVVIYEEAEGESEKNYIYMGCNVNTASTLRSRETSFESVSAVLKALSDKKRLEILSRLNKERSYCHELSESMNADQGNMSRNLAILYNYGFLRLEREAQRNYYHTDLEAIRTFLRQVEELLSR